MTDLSSHVPGNPTASSSATEVPVQQTIEAGKIRYPAAPATLDDTGIENEVLANLMLKLAHTVTHFTSEWAARKLCLPLKLAAELLEQLRREQSLDMLGQVGPFNFRFSITGRGRERARRIMEISGYVGPVPVSLEAYASFLEQQFEHLPQPTHDQVLEAISEMTLPEVTAEMAGLAVLSRRSLFLYGPPGNGKTTLGHLLHDVVHGSLWIPHCIAVNNSVIRVFDRECHELEPDGVEQLPGRIDRRWIRVKRPFVVVGGELTMRALDLIYSKTLGYYEAPLHFKANGGTFLLDDFGCQHVEPEKILNRWIHPLERGVDFLTLQTGQQLSVPFRQMLIVSTNLDPEQVMTPAFLRRMGYRVYLADADIEQYTKIFMRYAARCGLAAPHDAIQHLLSKYRNAGRPLRCCEPRDLIERAIDICRYRDKPVELNSEVLDLAWAGYFGC